jgi:hypothetical protein
VKFELLTNAITQILLQILYVTGNTNQDRKKRHEAGKLDKVLLIQVTPPPFDKHILFQPNNQCSIFSIMLSQIDLALNEAPKERPKYFIGKEETLQPKM